MLHGTIRNDDDAAFQTNVATMLIARLYCAENRRCLNV